jgi:hypothetical protein
MNTTLNYLIQQLEKIESHTITTDNVIFMAKSLLPNERDQMIDIGNRYHQAFKERGIQTITGKDLVEQLYGKENGI